MPSSFQRIFRKLSQIPWSSSNHRSTSVQCNSFDLPFIVLERHSDGSIYWWPDYPLNNSVDCDLLTAHLGIYIWTRFWTYSRWIIAKDAIRRLKLKRVSIKVFYGNLLAFKVNSNKPSISLPVSTRHCKIYDSFR